MFQKTSGTPTQSSGHTKMTSSPVTLTADYLELPMKSQESRWLP